LRLRHEQSAKGGEGKQHCHDCNRAPDKQTLGVMRLGTVIGEAVLLLIANVGAASAIKKGRLSPRRATTFVAA